MMDPQWRRVQELAEAMEACAVEQRSAWLEAQEKDPALRAQVWELLEALTAEADANRRAAAPPESRAPEFLGPYQILGLVGSGGRGRVYRAVREVAGGQQEVALKLLRNPLVTPDDWDRWRREQRILAGLSHPAIARFLDSGVTPDGQHYLVLEWIDGQPLDQYSASLPLRDRVRLMAEVLDALQAAHQSLVLHLDVKPSNILVERNGHVRLIDFGTAKPMAANGMATETQQFTPSYASPEQLRGEPVSTAADIYSAALTLWQLLTGLAPSHSSLAALAERATSDREHFRFPAEPDLESILEKALRFTPSQRYRSAAEFADDLRSWLDRRPVRARRATPLYRLQRFGMRHWRTAAALAGVVLFMVGMAIYAYGEQQRRLREAERGAAIASFLRAMIESSTTPATGRPEITVLEMIERAHRKIEGGTPLPEEVAALLQSDMSDFVRESGRDQQAVEIARAALRRAEGSGQGEARVAARRALAQVLLRLGNCAEAVRLYSEADELLASGSWDPRFATAYLTVRAAAKSRCEADPAGAVRLLESALERTNGWKARDSAVPLAVVRAGIYSALGQEWGRLRRFDEARAAIQAGLREAESHADGRAQRVALRRILGLIESVSGRHAEALAAFEEALVIAPGVVTPFEELRLHLMAAGQLADLGRKEAAMARVQATVARVDPERHDASRWMLFADAAEVMARAQACSEAVSLYRRVDDLIPGGRMPRDWLGNRLSYTAGCTADPARAAELARQALEAYGAMLSADSPRRRKLEALMAGR